MQMPQVYATAGKIGIHGPIHSSYRSRKLLSNAYKALRQILKVGSYDALVWS